MASPLTARDLIQAKVADSIRTAPEGKPDWNAILQDILAMPPWMHELFGGLDAILSEARLCAEAREEGIAFATAATTLFLAHDNSMSARERAGSLPATQEVRRRLMSAEPLTPEEMTALRKDCVARAIADGLAEEDSPLPLCEEREGLPDLRGWVRIRWSLHHTGGTSTFVSPRKVEFRSHYRDLCPVVTGDPGDLVRVVRESLPRRPISPPASGHQGVRAVPILLPLDPSNPERPLGLALQAMGFAEGTALVPSSQGAETLDALLLMALRSTQDHLQAMITDTMGEARGPQVDALTEEGVPREPPVADIGAKDITPFQTLLAWMYSWENRSRLYEGREPREVPCDHGLVDVYTLCPVMACGM